MCADIDLIYKITNSLDYEASRYAVIQEIEAVHHQLVLKDMRRRQDHRHVLHIQNHGMH